MDLVTSCKMILAKVFVYNPVVLKKNIHGSITLRTQVMCYIMMFELY